MCRGRGRGRPAGLAAAAMAGKQGAGATQGPMLGKASTARPPLGEGGDCQTSSPATERSSCQGWGWLWRHIKHGPQLAPLTEPHLSHVHLHQFHETEYFHMHFFHISHLLEHAATSDAHSSGLGTMAHRAIALNPVRVRIRHASIRLTHPVYRDCDATPGRRGLWLVHRPAPQTARKNSAFV